MSALYLSELTLSHFRSHHRVSMELDPRPVTLFGANGAGKTNILEAISMLSPGRGLRRAALDDISRKPENLGWKVSATLHTLGQMHEIATRSEAGSARTVSIDDKTSPQIALGRIARIVWLIPAMDRLWIEGAEGRRRFLDRITLSFEPKHAEASVIYERSMRERNKLLKDMVRDPMWYAALERKMAEAGAQIIANRSAALTRLRTAMEEAETSFPVADLSIEGPDDTVLIASELDLRTALEASRPNDLRAGRTLVGPHRIDMAGTYAAKGVAAKHCSTGEQKALLLSLILGNARALAQDFGAPPIILLDEVAAHLDADRRAALYDEVCALRAQAFMTGTGADLFAELTDRAQHFEIFDAEGASAVTQVNV